MKTCCQCGDGEDDSYADDGGETDKDREQVL